MTVKYSVENVDLTPSVYHSVKFRFALPLWIKLSFILHSYIMPSSLNRKVLLKFKWRKVDIISPYKK